MLAEQQAATLPPSEPLPHSTVISDYEPPPDLMTVSPPLPTAAASPVDTVPLWPGERPVTPCTVSGARGGKTHEVAASVAERTLPPGLPLTLHSFHLFLLHGNLALLIVTSTSPAALSLKNLLYQAYHSPLWRDPPRSRPFACGSRRLLLRCLVFAYRSLLLLSSRERLTTAGLQGVHGSGPSE